MPLSVKMRRSAGNMRHADPCMQCIFNHIGSSYFLNTELWPWKVKRRLTVFHPNIHQSHLQTNHWIVVYILLQFTSVHHNAVRHHTKGSRSIDTNKFQMENSVWHESWNVLKPADGKHFSDSKDSKSRLTVSRWPSNQAILEYYL